MGAKQFCKKCLILYDTYKYATHIVKMNGVETELCTRHYKEYLAEEDFSIEQLNNETYGDICSED